jgi:hypothetical protein
MRKARVVLHLISINSLSTRAKVGGAFTFSITGCSGDTTPETREGIKGSMDNTLIQEGVGIIAIVKETRIKENCGDHILYKEGIEEKINRAFGISVNFLMIGKNRGMSRKMCPLQN